MSDYVILPRKRAERISFALIAMAHALLGGKPKAKRGRKPGRKPGRKAKPEVVPASLKG
jgi:hypothetical protein